MRSFLVLCVLLFAVGCDASVKKANGASPAKANGAQPAKGSDLKLKRSSLLSANDQKSGDCYEALGDLAEKIAAQKHKEAQYVSITRDIEPNSKRVCKWIIVVAFYKEGYTAATPLKAVLADMQTLQSKIYQGLEAKKVKFDKADIEILQSTKVKPLMSSAVALERALTKRSHSRSGAAARVKPTKVEAGQRTAICVEHLARGYGTLGGILFSTTDNKLYTLTNNHVYDIRGDYHGKHCEGNTLRGAVADNAIGENSVAPADQVFTYADAPTYTMAGPISGKDADTIKLYAERSSDYGVAADYATVKIDTGKPVDCKIWGKAVQGVRSNTDTQKKARTDAKDEPLVWKYGATSGLTTGAVSGFTILDSARFWGYSIVGEFPDIPHRAGHRNPKHPAMDCKDCWRPTGNSNQITSAAEAAAATGSGAGEPWWPGVFVMGGDSGSWVLDDHNRVMCLVTSGSWVKRASDGLWHHVNHCMPFGMVLADIQARGGLAVRPCVDTDVAGGVAP